MDQAARGAAALKSSNFAEAVKQYTAAIAIHPESADYYIKRSTAYQRSSPPDFSAALSDAELAVILAQKRGRRESITEAQLRRAITLYHLERYADAEFVFGVVKKLNDKEKTLDIWNVKVAAKLKALPEGDERAQLKVKEQPEVEQPAELPVRTAEVTKTVVPTPKEKIRHEWYQSDSTIYFTLCVKGVAKDSISIDLQKNSLSISFPLGGNSTYDFSIDPLYQAIEPAESTHEIGTTKISVSLKKAVAGKWKALEGDHAVASPTEDIPSIPAAVLSAKPKAEAPSYPTSSKKGPKDWDKVAKELTIQKAGEAGSSGPDDDDLEGDETSNFFKHLFKGADPDQKRAMMKSFTESGGTVLSTDWNQVGSKTVVPEPPEGMEAKKYNE